MNGRGKLPNRDVIEQRGGVCSTGSREVAGFFFAQFRYARVIASMPGEVRLDGRGRLMVFDEVLHDRFQIPCPARN